MPLNASQILHNEYFMLHTKHAQPHNHCVISLKALAHPFSVASIQSLIEMQKTRFHTISVLLAVSFMLTYRMRIWNLWSVLAGHDRTLHLGLLYWNVPMWIQYEPMITNANRRPGAKAGIHTTCLSAATSVVVLRSKVFLVEFESWYARWTCQENVFTSSLEYVEPSWTKFLQRRGPTLTIVVLGAWAKSWESARCLFGFWCL